MTRNWYQYELYYATRIKKPYLIRINCLLKKMVGHLPHLLFHWIKNSQKLRSCLSTSKETLRISYGWSLSHPHHQKKWKVTWNRLYSKLPSLNRTFFCWISSWTTRKQQLWRECSKRTGRRNRIRGLEDIEAPSFANSLWPLEKQWGRNALRCNNKWRWPQSQKKTKSRQRLKHQNFQSSNQ